MSALLLIGMPSAFLFGQNWFPTEATSEAWHSIASSANAGVIVSAAFNGPMEISTNGGASWASTSAPITNWVGISCAADRSRILAVNYVGPFWQTNGSTSNTNTPFYTSTDLGKTWSATNFVYAHWAGPTDSSSSVACSADGQTLLAVSPEGIYNSTNGGLTWAVALAPNQSWSSVSCSANGYKCAAAALCFPICISGDAGRTWTPSGAPTNNWVCVASSADGGNLVAAANLGYCGDGRIYISTNSGASWTVTAAPSHFWAALASSADGLKIVAAFHDNGPGQIYTSTNAGASWMLADAPAAWWWSAAISADGGTIMAAPWGDRIYMSKTLSRPILSIAPAVTGSVLSWLVPSATFTLQENVDLATTNWTDVLVTPILNSTNLHYEVTVSPSAGQMFYRLASR